MMLEAEQAKVFVAAVKGVDPAEIPDFDPGLPFSFSTVADIKSAQ